MPREIAFHGVYMPTMTLMFFIAAGLAWGFDRLSAASIASKSTSRDALWLTV